MRHRTATGARSQPFPQALDQVSFGSRVENGHLGIALLKVTQAPFTLEKHDEVFVLIARGNDTRPHAQCA